MWLSTRRTSAPCYGCAKQGGSWREKESGEKAQEAGEERGGWHFILAPLLCFFHFQHSPAQQRWEEGKPLSRAATRRFLVRNQTTAPTLPIWKKSTPLPNCFHQVGDNIYRADVHFGGVGTSLACLSATQPSMHFI